MERNEERRIDKTKHNTNTIQQPNKEHRINVKAAKQNEQHNK